MTESLEHRLKRIETSLGSPSVESVAVPKLPNIVDFVVEPTYLNRPLLYPRQALLLKLIFLQLDLLTEYDYSVLEKWGLGSDNGLERNRSYGIPSDLIERLELLRSNKRLWVREFIAVIGRRGSKGYIGAISTSYILLHMMATGDPQGHFGMATGKTFVVPVFARSKDQARDSQWRDLADLITSAPCFETSIARKGVDRLSLWSPAQLAVPDGSRGAPTFEIVARESTESAARGYTSPIQLHDEIAQPDTYGASSSEDLYYASTQAQLIFGQSAFSYVASSPRHKTGTFYALYDQALATAEDGSALNPEKFPIQIPSWELYLDWEIAHEIARYPGGEVLSQLDRALVSEDDPDIQSLKRTNPNKYRVENEAQWAEVQLQFLDPGMVDRMFHPLDGRTLEMQEVGTSGVTYVMHVDLSKVGDNTALVIAHSEQSEDPMRPLIVIDLIRVWRPGDFSERIIDYSAVELEVRRYMESFRPERVTFDSWQSMAMIQNLTEYARAKRLRTQIQELQTTKRRNREMAETFKGALYDDRIRAPFHELARDELLYLQDLGSKVDHPTSGPMTTNDVAVCLFAVVDALLELAIDPGKALSSLNLRAMGQPLTAADRSIHEQLSVSRGEPRYKRLVQGKTTQERRFRRPR